MSLVEVTDLSISFGDVQAVRGLSFSLEAGGALGVVGESGSGKSASAYALLGLHRGTGARVGGSIRVAGVDVHTADDTELRGLRGAKAAMVFQDPLSSLDPYYAVGDQIAQVYRVHNRVSRRAARTRAVEVLDRVGIPDTVRRSRSRPHEFSGGMRQRALIAMALACEPQLLIADEPTTALDVTVQAQILDLLHNLRRETGMGLLLVTHDVGVAAESVDEVLVMRSGLAVERGPVAQVLGAPREPYTKALLSAVPRIAPEPGGPAAATGRAVPDGAEVLVEADGVRQVFGRGSPPWPPSTASPSPSATARRSASSGRAAAARPPSGGCSSVCWNPPPVSSPGWTGSRWSSRTRSPRSTRAAPWASPSPTRYGRAGSVTRARSGRASGNCWSASGSTRSSTTATRTSSAADSANASASHGRWPPNRG